MSVDEAMIRAKHLLATLPAGTECCIESTDVLHAIAWALEKEISRAKVTWAYELVAKLPWPKDEFWEREDLLAKLAYLAWNACRREGSYPGMTLWQERCVGAATAQEIVRNFLALTFAERSPALNRRFLADRPVLLAVCANLERDRSRRPALAAAEAALLYHWHKTLPIGSGSWEEYNYFAGTIAYYAAGSERQIGRFREHDEWLEVARAHFQHTANPRHSCARLEWSRLAQRYELHRSDEILRAIPAVTAAFHDYGMALDEAKSVFLEANALKAVGRLNESLSRFEMVRAAPAISEEPLFLGLTILAIGELNAQFGRYARAVDSLQEAVGPLTKAGAPLGLAHLHSITAEVFRNEGDLNTAVDEYRVAIAIYLAAHMTSWAAYIRVLLADTLIVAGREAEALLEVAAALPVFESSDAVMEGVALAVVRESVRRQIADPQAIRNLRERLEMIRQKGQL